MADSRLISKAGEAHLMRSPALHYRMGSRADLAYCTGLLPAGFCAHASVRRRLVDLWERLLASEARTFTVIHDLERPHPANIEGFGLSVFVTDRFFGEFCASPQPYVSALFYERMLAGEDVVLSPEQMHTANSAAGLNVISLHFGLRNEDLADSRTAQTLAVGSAAFFFFHGGYRINAMLQEVYGVQAARYMELGGFRLSHDFHRELPERFHSLLPQHHPYLFMLRRDWIEPGAVSPLSHLFSPPAPRLYFSASERRILEGALLNESDPQIAARLGVSIDTVKKAWRNIYARASRGIPNLLHGGDLMLPGARGQEKRRHLLDYLRTHLEELRPAGPVGRKSSKSSVRVGFEREL